MTLPSARFVRVPYDRSGYVLAGIIAAIVTCLVGLRLGYLAGRAQCEHR